MSDAPQAQRRATPHSRWFGAFRADLNDASRRCYALAAHRAARALVPDSAVYLWDSKASGAPHVLRTHAGAVNDVAFHPSARSMASVSDDGTCVLWSA